MIQSKIFNSSLQEWLEPTTPMKLTADSDQDETTPKSRVAASSPSEVKKLKNPQTPNKPLPDTHEN